MIKLQAVTKPVELTDDVVAKLTTEYKNTGDSVWRKDYITEPLLTMSFSKCCFCETKIDEESKYMEVEHFHPKSLYPDEVVLWINLLPICKRCNGKKSDHDTKLEPIIHPVTDNPKEHLKLKNYRFCKLTELGQSTIGVVYLNDRQRLVNKRFEIGEKLIEKLDILLDLTRLYVSESPIKKQKITGILKNLMLEGCKESAYSATAATVILDDDNYQEIKQLFITHRLWNDEFINLETEMNFCAFVN